MSAVPNIISPKEYLELEAQNPHRHEYRYGLVYAMSGGTDNHDRITFNLLKAIDNHLGDQSNCRFYSGSIKVSYQDEFYYYPDAFVTCDPRDRSDRLVKRYPKLIVEVLSSSTKVFDQGKKFEDYQQIESLEEYVLISQFEPWVECRRRPSPNTDQNTSQTIWETALYGPGVGVGLADQNRLILKSIGLDMLIADLYRGLD